MSLADFLAMAYFLGISCVEENISPDKKLQILEGNHKLTEQNKAILKDFMEEIWNKSNLDAADKFISTPYVIYHDPGDPWEGQSLDLPTFKKRVTHSRQIFPDLHFTIKEIISDDNKVAISWYLEGTHKGNINGLPATGNKVKVSGLTIYSFSKGKITGHWQIVDRLGFMQQVRPKDHDGA